MALPDDEENRQVDNQTGTGVVLEVVDVETAAGLGNGAFLHHRRRMLVSHKDELSLDVLGPVAPWKKRGMHRAGDSAERLKFAVDLYSDALDGPLLDEDVHPAYGLLSGYSDVRSFPRSYSHPT